MAIQLAEKYEKYVDEIFTKESRLSLLTNNDFEFTGAKTVNVYKISTASMNDYDRLGTGSNASRYGAVQSLDATTEDFTLTKDRSFTFAIDKLDKDETGDNLSAASALARQQRAVIIPEIDSYVYGVMATEAGHKPTAKTLTAANIYDEITAANEALDDDLVPETDRCIVVTPEVYRFMKQADEIAKNSDIGADLRKKGVVMVLDGCNVIKVPAARLPEDFGFMVAHPCATVAPVKLADYKVHEDPPGINGDLVEGRVVYDAFVLDNKAAAIYYQAVE